MLVFSFLVVVSGMLAADNERARNYCTKFANGGQFLELISYNQYFKAAVKPPLYSMMCRIAAMQDPEFKYGPQRLGGYNQLSRIYNQ